MKLTPQTGRLLAVLALALAGQAFGQTPPSVNYGLPQFQNVTIGRNVDFTVEGGTAGAVQWQVSTNGGVSFSDLAESSVYVGTKTKTLEVVGVTNAMGNYQFRFTNTQDGVTKNSSASVLTVSPLLVAMPSGIATDDFGYIYVSDEANHAIYRGALVPIDIHYPVVPMHVQLSALAGKPGETGAVDGTGAVARFNHPAGLAVSFTTGLVTVADSANNTLRQVSSSGAVTTLAGSSTSRGSVDGAGGTARFSAPLGVARTLDGSYYVADSANHTIRKVAVDGTVSTFAGSPGNAGSADGTGSAARFNHPSAVAVDSGGTVYVADTANNLIRKITSTGVVSTMAGVTGIAGSQDGSASSATFNSPEGIAVTRNGAYVFVADTGNSTIRIMYSLSGSSIVRTYVGVPTVSGMTDNYSGLLNHPKAIAVDGLTDYYMLTLYIADTGNAAIRQYSWNNGLETIMLGDGATSNDVPLPFGPGTSTGAPPTTPTTTAPVSTTTGTTSTKGAGSMDGGFLVLLGILALLRRVASRRE